MRSAPSRRSRSQLISVRCSTSCVAIARELRRPAAYGLSNGGRQDGAERRGGDDERGDRTLVDDIAQHDADHAADGDGTQRIREPTEPPLRALVILRKRPETFRAGCHLQLFYHTDCAALRGLIAPNTLMWLSTTRLRSSSSGSSVHTPRWEVPPRMMPSLRAIM